MICFMEKPKSKNRDLVSEKMALFNWSSVDYTWFAIWSK